MYLHSLPLALYHSPPLTTTHCHSPPLTTTHLHSLPLTTTHHHSPPLTTTSSLQLTATHHHSLPLTSTHSHSPPLTITHHNSLPLTTTHLHSLPLTTTHDHSLYCSLITSTYHLITGLELRVSNFHIHVHPLHSNEFIATWRARRIEGITIFYQVTCTSRTRLSTTTIYTVDNTALLQGLHYSTRYWCYVVPHTSYSKGQRSATVSQSTGEDFWTSAFNHSDGYRKSRSITLNFDSQLIKT